jgi:hypothetical protein
MANNTSLLLHKLSTRKDDKVRNTADIIASCQLRIFVGIDFEDDSLSGQISGSARDLRRCNAAWATPSCPEIDQYRDSCILYDLIEKHYISSNWLIDGRQRVLAGSATACVSKMGCRNTVLLAAVFACADHGHFQAPYFQPAC